MTGLQACIVCGVLFSAKGGKGVRCREHAAAPREAVRRAYEKRDYWVRRIGFPSYRAYLASELWAAVREKAFEKHGRLCRCCGRPATQVHHRGYGGWVLRGHDLNALTPLCGRCHRYIEFSAWGDKLTPKMANNRLRALARRLKSRSSGRSDGTSCRGPSTNTPRQEWTPGTARAEAGEIAPRARISEPRGV